MNNLLSKLTWLILAAVLVFAAAACAVSEQPAQIEAAVTSLPPTQSEAPPTALPTIEPTPEPQASPTVPAGLDPAASDNISYTLDILSRVLPESKGVAALKDGVFEQQYPGSAEMVSIRKIKEARGDLNGDGVEDAAVLLAVNTGGSGTFINLAAVLNENSVPRHAATKFLGDRVNVQSISVENGVIRIHMVTHAPEDPACCPSMEVDEEYQLRDSLLVTPEEGQVLPLAESAIRALQAKDMKAITKMTDPGAGLRFSPYSFVLPEHLVFTPDQIENLLQDPTIYTWGNFDGSGEPIQMSFADYYDRFVYSKDFAEAGQISLNQRLGMGNTLDNSQEFYPEAVVVEYYVPGENPEYAGMDWQSVRLVFQQIDGVWRLTGIIHDEWTT